MNVLKKVINPFSWFRSSDSKKCVILTPEEKLAVKLKPYQNYLFKLQEILLWKDPSKTLLFLASITLLFVMWSRMVWRFFGVIFSALLGLVLHEAWVEWIWPEIRAHPPPEETSSPPQTPQGVMNVSELSRCATYVQSTGADIIRRLKNLRQTHPAMFCGMVSTGCVVAAKAGSAVPGLGLLYILVVTPILLLGVFIHFVPPETKQKVITSASKLVAALRPQDSIAEVDEYLPEPSRENLTLFHLASGDTLDGQTNGSTPNSEIEVMPEDAIPSFDESSVERDSLGLEDLGAASLQFKTSHFNGASVLGAALSRALKDTLGTALVSPSPAPPAQDDSSDSSEFELLDPEESPP